MNPTSDGDSRLRIRAPTCGRLTAKPGVIIPVKALVELTSSGERGAVGGCEIDTHQRQDRPQEAFRRAAAADAAPTDRVIGLSPLQIQRRFTAAARAAGIEARVTAHSGRVGLASELTARGASTTEVMLAGNWKTARMVAHYSAGATAERGAVAKYL